MICSNCGHPSTKLSWLKERDGWCPSCFYAAEPKVNSAPMIATDSIPGGLEVKHGICNEDGSPRKFYSKSEIKSAAYETGWSILGDTPKVNPRLQDEKARNKEKSDSGRS